jgi:uncharacterized protein YejL (UPF0352 family)
MSKNKYQIHPLAAAFPALAGQDLNDLVADIKKHGIREPIVLFEGKILDGRNRACAAELAGLEEIPTTEFDPKKAGCSAEDFVISMNLIRRHLTPSQKSALAHEFMERMAGASVRNHGSNHATIPKPGLSARPAAEELEDLAAELHQKPAPAEPPADVGVVIPSALERAREADLRREYAKRKGPAKRQRAVIAEKFGVSEGLIDAARRVKARAPELYESVKAGKVSVQQALKEALVKTGEAPPAPRPGVLTLESKVRELVIASERSGGKLTVDEYKFTIKKKMKK